MCCYKKVKALDVIGVFHGYVAIRKLGCLLYLCWCVLTDKVIMVVGVAPRSPTRVVAPFLGLFCYRQVSFILDALVLICGDANAINSTHKLHVGSVQHMFP